jgi:Family of unknown function (DUF5946)
MATVLAVWARLSYTLVMSVKRIAYETGGIPAARCDPNSVASRKTLQKAGLVQPLITSHGMESEFMKHGYMPPDGCKYLNDVPLMTCGYCGAVVPDGYESRAAMFQAVLDREYSDPACGEARLFTADAHALQHSEEHGPRSNAFHLMPCVGWRSLTFAGEECLRRFRWLHI